MMTTTQWLAAGLAGFAMTAAASPQSLSPPDASHHYAGDLRLSPQTGQLAADWTLTVQEDDLTEVTFLLSAAFGEAEISGPHVTGSSSTLSEGFTGMMRRYTIALAPPVDGADRVIEMRYAGPLFAEPPETPINTLDADKVEFTVDSFWMPFDARFTALITADLDIWIPGAWEGVTMQAITPMAGGFHIDQDQPALDLAFTLMSGAVRHASDGYVIHDTREPAGANIDAVIAALDHCTDYLNTLAGTAGPLPDAAIVVTGREAGGYSRGTLIALTDIADSAPADITQFICHELGHYWSFGNAMTVENWLNESFADYIAIMGMRDAMGDAAFIDRMDRYRRQIDAATAPLPPVWTPQTTERPPYLVAYRKGPLVLAAMEAHVGRDVFADFIRAFMAERVSTTPQMLAVFEAVAGASARAEFERRLAE